MGRRQGSHYTGRALAALLALALLSGCSNTTWRAGWGAPPSSGPPPPGGSVSVTTATPSGVWLGLGILLGAVYGPGVYEAPPMEPSRRVLEQDCSKPIEDPSANLRCR